MLTSFNQSELDAVRDECVELGAGEVYTFKMDMTNEDELKVGIFGQWRSFGTLL